MKVIVTANNKGGVAKTTTAATLASIMATHGNKILLVDMDTQGNLTQTLKAEPTASSYTRQAITTTKPGNIAPLQIRPNLHLLTADADLLGIELDAANIGDYVANFTAYLERVAGCYDYAMIDTPPSLGNLFYMGIYAADILLIPTQAEPYAIQGLKRILDIMENVGQTQNATKHPHIIITRLHPNRNAQTMAIEAMRQLYGERVMQTIIHEQNAVVECIYSGQTVDEYAPTSRAARDYTAAAAELNLI